MTTIDSAPGESTQPRRVLLVDDSVDAAEAMSMLLETLGHEIRVMHDGPSALAMVDDFAPDVVILDIGLPGMDGFEVARELRTRVVTKTGFDHHLVKPVSFTAIETVIAESLSGGSK